LRRNDFGAGLSTGESDDGGFDEFCEFSPSCRRNSAISARNASTITAPARSRRQAAHTTVGNRRAPCFAPEREDQPDTSLKPQ
jgi:hypothetical protein